MIRQEDVYKAFGKWKAAGLISPATNEASEARLVDEFIEQFSFMDEDTLKFVATRLTNSLTWPNFALVRQAAQEYMDSNKKYKYIDYLADCATNAYGEKESFDAFVHRIAKTFFPKQPEAWIKQNEFTLNFYGVAMHGCQNCDGHCLHHGHKYHLRLQKGTGLAVPYGSLEICPKYKAPETKQNKPALPPEPEQEPNCKTDPEYTGVDNNKSAKQRGKKAKVEQQILIEEDS